MFAGLKPLVDPVARRQHVQKALDDWKLMPAESLSAAIANSFADRGADG
jgi:hypothetical protein